MRSPEAEALLVLRRHQIGKKSPPSARIVTPEAPVMAVKKAHARMVARGTPPGTNPVQARTIRTRRSGAPPGQDHPRQGEEGNAGKDGLRDDAVGFRRHRGQGTWAR